MNELQEFPATINVVVNGSPVKITSSIMPLGELSIGEQIIVQVVLYKTDVKIYGLTVDEKTRNIIPKKNRGFEISAEKNIMAYQKNIRVLGVLFPYTKPDQNCLVILENQNNGKIKYWELSVMNQDTQFYFIIQKVYEAQCFVDKDNKIACPYFSTEDSIWTGKGKNWPQLVELLQKLYVKTEKFLSLPIIYEEFNSDKANYLESDTGKVLYWNFRRNTGVIMTKNGAAKVYWRNIIQSPLSSEKQLAYLTTGTFVNFEKLITPTHQTNLEWEAIGIEKIEDSKKNEDRYSGCFGI